MGKFRRNGAPLPLSGLVGIHSNDSSISLEQVVVAAVDESYSAIYSNLTYMAVVCSVPQGGSRKKLQRQGQQPVAIAFIDGEEPGNFKRVGSQISQLEVKFASKHRTRHYDFDVAPLAVRLLTLADRVVKLVRLETDERDDFEEMVTQLNNQREPLLAYAPAQLVYGGISGNGHVTT